MLSSGNAPLFKGTPAAAPPSKGIAAYSVASEDDSISKFEATASSSLICDVDNR